MARLKLMAMTAALLLWMGSGTLAVMYVGYRAVLWLFT